MGWLLIGFHSRSDLFTPFFGVISMPSWSWRSSRPEYNTVLPDAHFNLSVNLHLLSLTPNTWNLCLFISAVTWASFPVSYIVHTLQNLGFRTQHFHLHASSSLLAFTTGSHTVRRPWKVCVQVVSCLPCCFCNQHFFQNEAVSLKPNPQPWRDMGLFLYPFCIRSVSIPHLFSICSVSVSSAFNWQAFSELVQKNEVSEN